jgi:hypothetical protein
LVSEICLDKYDVGQLVRVIGKKKAEPLLAALQQDVFDADYDIDLEVGTVLPFDKERRKEDMLKLVNVFGEAIFPELLDAFEMKNADDILARLQQAKMEQAQAAQSQAQQQAQSSREQAAQDAQNQMQIEQVKQLARAG